ncbi:MAG: disulfide bond formation protein B [Porticoccaceae bacterium]|jgi:disulfide bond formation protein DsbB|nr:disulfide bond formation protein B [Porticoccaceae bacterium]
MAGKNEKPPCAMCKLIRTYMLVAVPMILIMYVQPEFTRLEGVALTDLFASFIGFMFVLTVLWKAYQEYWKPKRDAARKNRS